MLARLRAALEGKIRFVVIQYPGWREMLAAGAGFDVLVDATVSQIQTECGEDDFYLLAGYSFGGFVAWEAARRLVEYGHRVSFLGLIDTRYATPPRARRSLLGRVGRTLRSALLRPRELLSMAPRRIIAALIWMSGFHFCGSLSIGFQI